MSNFNEQPADLVTRFSSLNLKPEALEGLLDVAWRNVLLGQSDFEDINEVLSEDELEEWGVDAAAATQVFKQVLEVRREQLKRAPAGLVPTQLTRAFDELNAKGIVARQNFSCCGSCAPGEIQEERTDESRGYVYFHVQDAERLVEDRSTYLGYGVFHEAFWSEAEWDAMSRAEKDSAYEKATLDLMNSIVLPTFKSHGITVNWDGTLKTRIFIEGVDYIAEV